MSSPDIATVLALRLDVAHQIARRIKHFGVNQLAAAKHLGIPQPTLSKVVNGRVSDLSLELLIRIAVRAGLPMTLQTGQIPDEAGAFVSGTSSRAVRASASALSDAARDSRAHTERKLTPTQRLDAFLEHNQLLAELHLASHKADSDHSPKVRPR
jgi:predicted XRE-type DNA-binding protein